MKVFCSLLPDGWILIEPEGAKFHEFLRFMKRDLYVLIFEKKYKRHTTSIYEFEKIYNYCLANRIQLHVTSKLLRYYRRFKYKLELLEKERKNKQLELDLWTDSENNQLRNYQKKFVNAAITARRFLCGDQMGVGKTPEAIAVMLKAMQDYEAKTTLVVCPTRIQNQWENEIYKFTKLETGTVEIIDRMFCFTGEVEKYNKGRVICKGCRHNDKW